MTRERLLILYAVVVGGAGWFILLLTPQPPTSAFALLLFGLLALLLDGLSFRVPPTDPYSMRGVALLGAALTLGPAPAAMLAATTGLIFGLALPFVYRRPRTLYALIARPLLRSGVLAMGVLSGGVLASAISGLELNDPLFTTIGSQPWWLLLVCMVACYSLVLQFGRIGRELLQGGKSGVQTWWRSAWRVILLGEVATLPLAALLAAIFSQLGPFYFLLAGLALLGTSAVVRRSTMNYQSQRRSVRELALLNEVSRAIIRSPLDAEALCDLVYREATKIVDTSSFHLGLFEGDRYTLVVRVQDRVRLPPLIVTLEAGDGLIGWIKQTGRSLLVEDFASEMSSLPARPRYQSDRPPRSGVYVPLIAGDNVIGSISVQSYQPGAFSANDLRLLSLIADQAAVAITRARAYGEANQRAVQLQAIHEVSERITAILNLEQLLASVVRLIRERFHYNPVHIFTIEPESDEIVFRASTDPLRRNDMAAFTIPLGYGIVGSAAASGQPIVVGDVHADPRYITGNLATRSELAVPLRIGDQVIGVLDVQSDEPDDFNADDLFIMRTLADQIAIAIDSANSYAAQQEEAWLLNAMLQVAENVGRATTLDELLAMVVRLPPLLVGCDRCLCLLWEREDDAFQLVEGYGLSGQQREKLVGQTIAASAAPLLTKLRDEVRLLTLPNAQQHAGQLPQIVEPCGSGTLVLLPILARASLLGALLIDYNAPEQPLGSRQLALYSGVIGQIASALESALLANEAAEAARLEQELRVAREIQTALLPAALPEILGWDIAADWRSARIVGGDFYDFWRLKSGGPKAGEEENGGTGAVEAVGAVGDGDITHPPQQSLQSNANFSTLNAQFSTPSILGFVIADVSDKGVPAAMFMALSRSLMRAAALDGSPPHVALERANRWITRDSESGMFVTLFYGLLDTDSGHLWYSCAGHNPPLLYRAANGCFEELTTKGIALGVLEEITLHQAETTLDPGDVLVCYTDGLTESVNEELEEYGVERLRACIMQHAEEGASAVLNALTSGVTHFTSGQPPFDDVTLVVMKRTGASIGGA